MTNIINHWMTILRTYTERWLRIFINVFLICLILITFIYEVLNIFNFYQSSKIKVLPTQTPVYVKEAKVTPVSLTRWHLFGIKQQSNADSKQSKWMLRGILHGANPHEHLAILVSSDADEGTYAIGDKLPDGSLISSIQENKVTIIYNGMTTTLTIPWDTEQLNSPATDAPVNQQ